MRDVFEEEVADGLDAIEALLPRLADRDAVRDLYGHAHVLRGSAAVMGIGPAASVAAALSEVFEAVLSRGGERCARMEQRIAELEARLEAGR